MATLGDLHDEGRGETHFETKKEYIFICNFVILIGKDISYIMKDIQYYIILWLT